MLKHVATLIAYFVASFGVQATNHFVLNTEHYASEPIIDPHPVIYGGVIVIIVQGLLLSIFYARVRDNFSGVWGAVVFSWTMGLFLGAYIALAEPSKYLVSDMLTWSITEATVSFVQFTVFGLFLGLIYRSSDKRLT